jgi:hypothetical protein
MAGIGLVDRQHEQLDGRHREIDVDADLAAEVAEVLAEREPVLVAHDLELDSFVVRQLDQTTRPCTRLLDHRPDYALDVLGRNADRLVPALVTLRQRPVARKQLLESLVRRREDGFIGVGGPHAVAALHFVCVRAGLAGEHAGVRA